MITEGSAIGSVSRPNRVNFRHGPIFFAALQLRIAARCLENEMT
jgi:hypothetical protein